MITETISTLALGGSAGVAELAGLMFYGLGVVLGTLTLLALITHLVGKLFVKYSPAKVVEATPAKATPAPAPQVVAEPQVQEEVVEEIPAEVMAVISAVMNEVIESRHKKVNLRPKGIKDWSWSHSGRSSHHSSHKLR